MSNDFGETRHPKAAKEHRCEWCGETILKGEQHAHHVGRWEGEFQNWRMHSECNADAAMNGEIEDGFMPYEHKRPMSAPSETERRSRWSSSGSSASKPC